MKITLASALTAQRRLLDLPHDMARFQEYLCTMFKGRVEPEMLLPLMGFNPMSKEHVVLVLDRLLKINAEEIALEAVREAAGHAGGEPLQLCLVVADDLKGGWTNRYTSEWSMLTTFGYTSKRHWLVVTWWSSEPPTVADVRIAALRQFSRHRHMGQKGVPKSLGEVIAQEADGFRLAQAGGGKLPDEAVRLLEHHAMATDMPTLIAAYFGNPAAEELGYASLGLPWRAGERLARMRAMV